VLKTRAHECSGGTPFREVLRSKPCSWARGLMPGSRSSVSGQRGAVMRAHHAGGPEDSRDSLPLASRSAEELPKLPAHLPAGRPACRPCRAMHPAARNSLLTLLRPHARSPELPRPPDAAARRRRRPPLQEYIRHLIFERLGQGGCLLSIPRGVRLLTLQGRGCCWPLLRRHGLLLSGKGRPASDLRVSVRAVEAARLPA
jgi:hypothetical protein